MRPTKFWKVSSLTLAALLSLPATLMAQTLGVAFGGDYNDGTSGTTSNAALTSPTQDTGDFDFDGNADDARYLLPITNAYKVPLASNTAITGVTTNIYAGYQAAYVDQGGILTVTGPVNYKQRFNTTNDDTLQASPPANLSPAVSTNVVFAPNSIKQDFLNGFNSVPNVGFLDAAASVTFDVSKLPTTGASASARAMVKSGSDWYVSATVITSAAIGSLNGYTENWYPYDPATNLAFNESALGTPVPGSAIDDIQAFGVWCQLIGHASTSSVVSGEFLVRGFTADFVASPPPPTSPVVVLNTRQYTRTSASTVETFEFEVVEAPDRKLVVTYNNETSSAVTGIKYGTRDLIRVVSTDGTTTEVAEIWYLDDPDVGVANLEVTLDLADGNGYLLGAATLANAADGVSVSIQGPQATVDQYDLGLTTVANDTLVVGAYTSNATSAIAGEFYPVEQRISRGNSGSSYSSSGYVQVDMPSPATYSWVRGSSQTSSAVLVGFAAAGELPEITTSPITVWNSAENFESSGTATTNTIEDFTIDLNSFRKLVVTIVDENSGATTSVTYGGLPLTLAEGELNNAEIWYLDNPPVGTADIVATFGSVTNSRMGAISLVGAAPGVDATSSTNGISLATANLDLTTVSTNALIVGSYYNDDAGIGISSTPFGLNVIMQGDAGLSNSNAGFKTLTFPGLDTLTWVNDSPATVRAVAASFAPAEGFTAPANPGLRAFRIPALTVTPTIDGTISLNEWDDAFELPMVYPDIENFPNVGDISLTNNKDGANTPSTEADATESDISARVLYKWDAEYLYVAFDVKDDIFIAPDVLEGSALGDTSPFPDDHVLLTIDPDVTNNPATDAIFVAEFFLDSLGRSNYNFREELSTVNDALGNFANHQYAVTQAPGVGYVIEVALKWTDITGDPNYVGTAGNKFGAAVLLIDNDAADGFRDIIMRSSGSPTDQAVLAQVTLDAPGSYDAWILGFPAVGAETGKGENPDGDFYTNEQEWILGGNPGAFTNRADLEPTFNADTVSGEFEFTYDRRKNAAQLGITYEVEVDTDLAGFDVIDPTYTPDPSPTSINAEFEEVTDTVDIDEPRKFLRLRFEGPAN